MIVVAAAVVWNEDRKVLLSRNFRSSGGVLSACNDVFSMCMCPEVGGLYYGAEEALYEGIPHVTLPEPEAELCCVDVREQTPGSSPNSATDSFHTTSERNLIHHEPDTRN